MGAIEQTVKVDDKINADNGESEGNVGWKI